MTTLSNDINYFQHARMIQASEVIAKCKLDAKYEENKLLTEYVQYFNQNYICNHTYVTVHYNKNVYSKLSDYEFWIKFYNVMVNSGYMNIRLEETETTYVITADIM